MCVGNSVGNGVGKIVWVIVWVINSVGNILWVVVWVILWVIVIVWVIINVGDRVQSMRLDVPHIKTYHMFMVMTNITVGLLYYSYSTLWTHPMDSPCGPTLWTHTIG